MRSVMVSRVSSRYSPAAIKSAHDHRDLYILDTISSGEADSSAAVSAAPFRERLGAFFVLSFLSAVACLDPTGFTGAVAMLKPMFCSNASSSLFVIT